MRAFVPRTAFVAHSGWPVDLYLVEEHAFAVELDTPLISLSVEHTAFDWLDYETAFQRLHWQSNQTALWELAERIRDETLSVLPIGEAHPG
jgi:dATP pyrophosphohydrolase